MEVLSRRLGRIEVPDDSGISFPRGLVGLPERKRFVILEFGSDIPMGWLQDLDDPNFALPVAEPAIYTENYEIELEQREISELELADVGHAAILVVSTIGFGGRTMTGNLQAPLVVNTRTRIGKQIVLDRPDLDLRAAVDPLRFARAVRRLESIRHRGEERRPAASSPREDPEGASTP
jgi:flagellar assembly factor FliW